jgi:hypothetical protein
VGLSDIALLPAGLLFLTEDMSSDQVFIGHRRKLEGKSIQNLVSAGEARIASVASDSASSTSMADLHDGNHAGGPQMAMEFKTC